MIINIFPFLFTTFYYISPLYNHILQIFHQKMWTKQFKINRKDQGIISSQYQLEKFLIVYRKSHIFDRFDAVRHELHENVTLGLLKLLWTFISSDVSHSPLSLFLRKKKKKTIIIFKLFFSVFGRSGKANRSRSNKHLFWTVAQLSDSYSSTVLV